MPLVASGTRIMKKADMVKVGIIFLISNILLIYAEFITPLEGLLGLTCILIFFIYPHMKRVRIMEFGLKGAKIDLGPPIPKPVSEKIDIQLKPSPILDYKDYIGKIRK